MALFKRKQTTFNDDVVMPQELQEYYAAEGRNRNWMAWVLGLATLVITVVVALGLFYGGRYAYRKVRNNDTKTATNQGSTQTPKKDDDKATTDSDANKDTNPAATTTPQTSSTSTSTPSTTTPATAGAKSTNIPNTGPESTLAVFVAVTVLGYILHRRFATK